ncbi:MAG TPA: STAS domain-containing protein [Azospirillum sp.]|nr:STAS domain-containing protein [Azospirillum sp.]
MQIREETRNGILVLIPRGRIDSGTSAAFEARLAQAVSGGKATVVIDLAEVTAVGSVGLRSLLVATKAARAAGSRIVLAGLPESVRQAFVVSGFSGLFAVHPNLDAAIRALSGHQTKK